MSHQGNIPNAKANPTGSGGLLDYATDRFQKLCVAAGFGSDVPRAVATLRQVLAPLGDLPLQRASEEPNKASTVLRIGGNRWVSEISDDNTPIEFSVAIAHGRTEVRALFEATGSTPTLESYREAGMAMFERLEREFGADLTRYRQLQDLFLPEGMCGPFTVWGSVVFAPGQSPSFKAYFNPQARGPARAGELVDEALRRLGLPRTWSVLCRTIARRGPHLDELKYFALDLTSTPHARIKVYVRHHEATPNDLEVACSGAQEYVAGEALDFASAMAGGEARLTQRATFTCSAFVGGQGERPISTTLYVPICAYAPNDAEAKQRVDRYLADGSIDSKTYDGIIDGYTNRPLDSGVGMQSWVAFRRYRGEPRLTVYLATEANEVFAPRTIPASTAEHTAYMSAEDVLRRVARYDLAQHPFVRRLNHERNSAATSWLLIANVYEGTSKHFIHWLATLTARVKDDRTRSHLAHQLNQELGEGNYNRSHPYLSAHFLAAIEPLRPADFQAEQLASGIRLGERLRALHMSDDPLEGVGALMAGRFCSQQLIEACRELLMRHAGSVDPDLLDWLWLHDENEADVLEPARFVPQDPSSVESFARGALGLHTALWDCLDDLYAACFAGSLRPPPPPSARQHAAMDRTEE